MKIQINSKHNNVKSKSIKKLISNSVNTIVSEINFIKSISDLGLTPVVNILLTDNKSIKKYNMIFRGRNVETDVLSFPAFCFNPTMNIEDIRKIIQHSISPEKEVICGDIVISSEKALDQASMINQTYEKEIVFLVIHSILHIDGYDHMTPSDEEIMITKQKEIISYIERFEK